MQTSIGWLPALALFLGLLIATINTIDATDIGSHIDTQDVASRDDLLLRVDAAGILPHGSTSDITSRDDAVPQSVARDAKTRANINDVAPRGVYAHAITDYATTRHEEAGLLDARGGNEATADSFKDALIKRLSWKGRAVVLKLLPSLPSNSSVANAKSSKQSSPIVVASRPVRAPSALE